MGIFFFWFFGFLFFILWWFIIGEGYDYRYGLWWFDIFFGFLHHQSRTALRERQAKEARPAPRTQPFFCPSGQTRDFARGLILYGDLMDDLIVMFWFFFGIWWDLDYRIDAILGDDMDFLIIDIDMMGGFLMELFWDLADIIWDRFWFRDFLIDWGFMILIFFGDFLYSGDDFFDMMDYGIVD